MKLLASVALLLALSACGNGPPNPYAMHYLSTMELFPQSTYDPSVANGGMRRSGFAFGNQGFTCQQIGTFTYCN